MSAKGEARATRDFRLGIAHTELPNGMQAIAIENPGVRTCALAVSLRISPLVEGEDEHGLAHLVGSAIEEGTRQCSASEFSDAVEALGAQLDTSVRGGVLQCPVENRRKGLKLLREAVFEPSFPARPVRRVQDEIATEIRAEGEDARTVAQRRFWSTVYGAHPLGRPSHGEIERVLEFRPADLRRFHRRWFQPDQGLVLFAGPLPGEEALDLLRSGWSSLKGASPERPDWPDPVGPRKGSDQHLSMDREQVHLFAGHLGVRRNDPDYERLLVMDHVLGSGPGFTSRISRKLRDEMGLCYSVHAGICGSAGRYPGTFSAYIGTSPKHREKALRGFRSEVRRLQREAPSAEELQDVQDYLTGSFVLGLERNVGLIQFAVRCLRLGLGLDYATRYPSLIRGVSAEQVREVARRHLHPERLTVVSAGAGSSSRA